MHSFANERIGASSGIGLASAQLLLDIGAFVIAGDLTPSPIEHKNHTHVRTDVTDWANLKALFNTAKQLHGRVDHVFANAGIGGITDYMPGNEKLDANSGVHASVGHTKSTLQTFEYPFAVAIQLGIC